MCGGVGVGVMKILFYVTKPGACRLLKATVYPCSVYLHVHTHLKAGYKGEVLLQWARHPAAQTLGAMSASEGTPPLPPLLPAPEQTHRAFRLANLLDQSARCGASSRYRCRLGLSRARSLAPRLQLFYMNQRANCASPAAFAPLGSAVNPKDGTKHARSGLLFLTVLNFFNKFPPPFTFPAAALIKQGYLNNSNNNNNNNNKENAFN